MLPNYGTTTRNNRIIPNGALIGGVANFYTNTRPTSRVNGSALVIGDLWYNPNTGVQGFWNGTWWLSSNVSKFSQYFNSTPSSGATVLRHPSGTFLQDIEWQFGTVGAITWTNTDYVWLSLRQSNYTNAPITITTQNTSVSANSETRLVSAAINKAQPTFTSSTRGVVSDVLQVVVTGAGIIPPIFNLFTMNLRDIL